MRQFQIYGVLALLVSSIILGVIGALYPNQTWTFIIMIAGYAFSCLRILYEQWDKFYLFVQKVRCKMCGLDTLWSLTVRYEIEGSEPLLMVRNTMLQKGLSDIKITHLNNNVLDVRSQGINMQFIQDEDLLEVHIFDMPVTYNRAESVISKTLSPIFEQLENQLKIKGKHYFLAVKFLELNPFIGLYMRKIASKDLLKFDISFTIDNNRIEVYKDKIVLNTNSISQLTSLSKDVLALSPR